MQHPPPLPPPSEQATVERMSPETLAAVADVDGINRSHIPILSQVDHNVYAKNLRAALVPQALRSVRFELVWCEMSVPDTGYASWVLADTMKKLSDPRNVRMWTFEGVNHFVSFFPMNQHPHSILTSIFILQSLIGMCRKRRLSLSRKLYETSDTCIAN